MRDCIHVADLASACQVASLLSSGHKLSVHLDRGSDISVAKLIARARKVTLREILVTMELWS